MDEIGETQIESWGEYETGAREAISRSNSSVLLFDPDLANTGLERAAGVEQLTALLLRSAQPQAIRILLRDGTHLGRNCPRLLKLLTDFGHRIAVKVVSEGPALPETAFLVGDGTHLLIRFHHARPRGKLSSADASACAQCTAQFETLWATAGPGPSTVPLGL